VAAGSAGTSNVTIVPANGYTGTVSWSISSAPSLTQGCFTIADAAVADAASVLTKLTIDASAATCGTALRATKSLDRFADSGRTRPGSPALMGFIFLGLLGSRWRRRDKWLALLLVLAGTASLVACGGSNVSSTSRADAVKGIYTVTITGTDTASSAITASATFQLTVD
jgi:hypothetical protein